MRIYNKEPERINTIMERISPQLSFEGTSSMTKSEFADECDINNIVKRSIQSGVLPQGTRQPMFGDFTQVQSYEDAQKGIVQAQEQFLNLPSDIRAKFGNSVAELLDYIANPENQEEAIKLGLLPQPETTETPVVETTSTLEEVSENNESSES